MSTKPLAVLTQNRRPAKTWSLGVSSQSNTAAAMLFIDFLTLALVFALAVFVRHLLTPSYHLISYFQFFPCIAALLLGFGLQGLYPGVMLHPADEMRRIFLAVSTVFLLMTCAMFLERNAEAYSRSVFLLTWCVGSPCVLLIRRASRRLLSHAPWWGVPAIVLGSGPAAQRVVGSLRDGIRGIKVVGFLSDDEPQSPSLSTAPFLGPISSAPLLAQAKKDLVAIVTIAVDSQAGNRHTIQDFCRGFSRVILVPDIPGLCSLGVSVKEIGGELGLEMPQRLFQYSSAFAKRFIDLILSALAVALLSPLFISLAIAVKISSPGKVFFGQQRCGRDGLPFTALKFRTMVPNAEQALADHLLAHPGQMMEWNRDQKLKNDPRVTRIGKWMRRLSLDELPQLFNVLAGDMSLIGPRPIIDSEIHRYGRAYNLYSRVRPGMTGLWQVSGRNRTTYAQRVALDEFYVNNWSVWLDLYILSRTLQVVVTADGAY